METATAVPPDAKRIEIPYRPCQIQKIVHDDQHRIRVVVWGRRSGKSLMAIVEGFCMSYDCVQHGVVRPRGIIVAPTNKMLRENWMTANVILKQAIVQSYVSEFRLDLGPLGLIDFTSTESQGGAGRGAGHHWAVVDEASRVPKDAWESDVEPSLADTAGRALIISTPDGLNWFYDLYRRGQDADPDVSSYRASTIECWKSRFLNAHAELQKRLDWLEGVERRTSHMRFRQEYLAEFLQGEGQTFHIKPETSRGNLRGPVPGRHYSAGLDVARKEDWMVTSIVEIESQQLVGLTRSRHQDWALQKAQSAALLHQYNGEGSLIVHVDSTGVGDPIAEDIRKMGFNVIDVIFGSNNKIKGELVENLLIALEQSYLGIPKEEATEWLYEELYCYETRRMPSGAIKYGAPEGRHDDGVTSLFLACKGLQGQWANPKAEEVITPNWWERNDPWAMLDYEHQVKAFRSRFPNDPAPIHPTDLAWSRMGPMRN